MHGEIEMYTGFCWENLRERDALEEPGVDGIIILEWFFKNWYVRAWTVSMWFRIGTGGGHM
jgi:hypothetical protein